MNRDRLLPAAALMPGLIFAALSLVGLVPTGRDLPGYFFPLRTATVDALRGNRSLFWTLESGCGEPFFANLQSALLYPPAWLGLVLPVPQAVGVEIGLHLAVLALGIAMLSQSLGAKGFWPVAAGWSVALAGPILDSAVLLANLTTLTWLPWLWWATLERRPRAMAGFLALSILGAEPQLAAGGAAVALTLGPLRRTLPPVLLGCGVLAVQLVPFFVWIAGGDRALSPDVEWAAAGAISLVQLPGLLFQGIPVPEGHWGYVLNPTLPLWMSVIAGWALVRGGLRLRKTAVWGLVFLGLSLLPAFGVGAEVWLVLSRGLVRYPGRWLFLTVLLLAPAAAAAADRLQPRLRGGLAIGMGAWLLGLGLGSGLVTAGIQAAALGTVIAFGSTAGAMAALAACLALLPGHIQDLGLTRDWRPPQVPCLEHQVGTFRVYSVEYSRHLAEWLDEAPEVRGAGLGLGYLVLLDGRRTARSFGPLKARPLVQHLAQADRGQAGVWWLDALGAARFVSYRPVPGFPVICREHGVVVMENPRSWPIAAVVRGVPEPGEPPVSAGSAETLLETGGRRIWRVRSVEPGVLLWLETPDRGWRAWVDGERSQLYRGPGIVQAIPVAAGSQLVEVRYRPSGVVLGGAVSLVALGLILGVTWRRW